MKRIWCIFLGVLLITAVLTGCAKKEEDTSSFVEVSPSPQAETVGPYRIGLVQDMEFAPYDEAREAFMSRLEEWGFSDSRLQVDYQNAGGDSGKLEEICKEFAKNEKDVVVAVSAPAAKAAAKACESTDTKVVFLGVYNPHDELGIADPANPDGNITGVADVLTARPALELALQVDGTIQNVGLLYDPGCPFTSAYVEAVKTHCGELGINLVEGQVTGKDQVQTVMQELCGQVDAVLSPIDSTISSAAKDAAKTAQDAGVPWYAATEDVVEQGALACVSIDYAEAGNRAADIAVKLVAGEAVSSLPVYHFETGRVSINPKTMAALAVVFPEEVLELANYQETRE